MKTKIPESFYQKNNLAALYYVLHGSVLWIGFGYAAFAVYAAEHIPLILQIPLIAIFVFLSGFGLFFIGTLGHEGFHGNMNSNRDVSMLLGTLASSAVPFFVSVGYTVIHWQHHLHTNTLKDPDYVLYRKYRTFLSRVLLGPSNVMLSCVIKAINLIFCPEKNGNIHYPFSRAKARFFAILNLTLMVTVAFFYFFFAVSKPDLFAFLVAMPYMVVGTYFAMCPYIEHADTLLMKGENTRTYTAKLFTVLLLGYSYHREHHLYPNVQVHKLIFLHRYLKKNGHISDKAVIEPRFFEVLKIGATRNLEFHQ